MTTKAKKKTRLWLHLRWKSLLIHSLQQVYPKNDQEKSQPQHTMPENDSIIIIIIIANVVLVRQMHLQKSEIIRYHVSHALRTSKKGQVSQKWHLERDNVTNFSEISSHSICSAICRWRFFWQLSNLYRKLKLMKCFTLFWHVPPTNQLSTR